MTKFTNNYLAAVIIFFTSIRAAPGRDDIATMEKINSMQYYATAIATVRHHTKAIELPRHAHTPEYFAYHVSEKIARAVILKRSPYTMDQLGADPDESMLQIQIEFARMYHFLVFEKLKTLFHQIQLAMIGEQSRKFLQPGLDKVALKLLEHHDLEGKYRARLGIIRSPRARKLQATSPTNELELPTYDWERLRNIPQQHDLSRVRHDAGALDLMNAMWRSVRNVVANRSRDVHRKLPGDVLAGQDPKKFFRGVIADIVSTPSAATSAFTKEQLMEEPDESMPKIQILLTRIYHHLVFEKLKTLFEKIKNNMDIHAKQQILEPALADVARAMQRHYRWEAAYEKFYMATQCQRPTGWRRLEVPAYEWERLDSIENMELSPEGQAPTSHDDAISDNALGFRLGASTSQSRPCVVDRVTRGDSVDYQPQSVRVHYYPMQRGLIAFPGISDTAVDATPDFSLRLGYSHERVPLSHDCVGNELRRPPCDHVGLVGGSSTALERSTEGNYDSSLHGHETVDSPRSHRRVKLFGAFIV
ncbi:hypothetical protein SeMB42_g03839 [Synchytrium endobioticum]|nr:hypothetical protein SeMB42_g03839 [Synchytrium endobioticum]